MQVGSTIGQYRVLRKIGEGGMGVVFEGEHVLIGRRAAIKVLKREVSNRRGTIERFFNEARATAAIRDPSIAQLFDVGITSDKRAYIVMELLAGESLDKRLQRVGALAPRDALRIVRQIAGALAVVHAAGVIHRDLKPANLFSVADPTATGGERIKILDFGVAKLRPDLGDGARTRAGAIVGTPIYMSPEQCSGTVIDERADIYSLGCVLFHLLTGRPPFALKGAGLVIAAHLTEPPPPPSRFEPQLAPELDALVLRCLAKSRTDRFPSMAELGDECDRLLALSSHQLASAMPRLGQTTTVPLTEPTTLTGMAGAKPRSTMPRRRWIGAAIAVGVLAASLAAVAVARIGDALPATVHMPAPAARIEGAAPPIAAPAPPATAIDATTVSREPPADAPSPPVAESVGARPPAAKPPAVTKPATKPRPPPRREDVYDDRN